MVSFNSSLLGSISPLYAEFHLHSALEDVERSVSAIMLCHRAYGLAQRDVDGDLISYAQAPHGMIGIIRQPDVVVVSVMSSPDKNQWYGQMLAAIRRIRGAVQVEHGDVEDLVPPAMDHSAGFAKQLARLGLPAVGVDTLTGFVDALAGSAVAIITPKARQLAEDCVYRNPARLAQAMVDIIQRTGGRTKGCSDQLLYETLPGFRINLSESQLTRFRADYVALHNGQEYIGRLHVTLGTGRSPARCASVHWAIQGVSGPVVFTRIGEHGRNAST